MWLDLRDGTAVRLNRNHNCQGARQPAYMHIGARKGQKFKGKALVPSPGLGTVVRRDVDASAFVINVGGASMKLGIWWLDAAARGAVECLPILPQRAVYEGDEAPAAAARLQISAAAAASRVARGRGRALGEPAPPIAAPKAAAALPKKAPSRWK